MASKALHASLLLALFTCTVVTGHKIVSGRTVSSDDLLTAANALASGLAPFLSDTDTSVAPALARNLLRNQADQLASDDDKEADLLRRFALWAPPVVLVPRRNNQLRGQSSSSSTSRQVLVDTDADGHQKSVIIECKNGICHQQMERSSKATSKDDSVQKTSGAKLDKLSKSFATLMRHFQQSMSRPRTNSFLDNIFDDFSAPQNAPSGVQDLTHDDKSQAESRSTTFQTIRRKDGRILRRTIDCHNGKCSTVDEQTDDSQDRSAPPAIVTGKSQEDNVQTQPSDAFSFPVLSDLRAGIKDDDDKMQLADPFAIFHADDQDRTASWDSQNASSPAQHEGSKVVSWSSSSQVFTDKDGKQHEVTRECYNGKCSAKHSVNGNLPDQVVAQLENLNA